MRRPRSLPALPPIFQTTCSPLPLICGEDPDKCLAVQLFAVAALFKSSDFLQLKLSYYSSSFEIFVSFLISVPEPSPQDWTQFCSYSPFYRIAPFNVVVISSAHVLHPIFLFSSGLSFPLMQVKPSIRL